MLPGYRIGWSPVVLLVDGDRFGAVHLLLALQADRYRFWLASWLFGCLAGLAGWLAGWLPGWLVGWLVAGPLAVFLSLQ